MAVLSNCDAASTAPWPATRKRSVYASKADDNERLVSSEVRGMERGSECESRGRDRDIAPRMAVACATLRLRLEQRRTGLTARFVRVASAVALGVVLAR